VTYGEGGDAAKKFPGSEFGAAWGRGTESGLLCRMGTLAGNVMSRTFDPRLGGGG